MKTLTGVRRESTGREVRHRCGRRSVTMLKGGAGRWGHPGAVLIPFHREKDGY